MRSIRFCLGNKTRKRIQLTGSMPQSKTRVSATSVRHLSPVKTVLTLATLVAFVVELALAFPAQAQTFTTLHSFQGTDGNGPNGDLVRDSAGNLYGTTVDGGGAGPGVVFKLTSKGKLIVLHRFTGGADGGTPSAGVVLDASGKLYGTTYVGGAYGYGVVFKLSPQGHERVLRSFAGGKDGAGPVAPLVLDAAGNVYGTTYYGGDGGCDDGNGLGCGVVFKIAPAGKETILHHFSASGDGYNPSGGLLWGPNGSLYGTTVAGVDVGGVGGGIVFKIDQHGRERIIYQLGSFVGDGYTPRAGLIRDAKGSLYGTTQVGGTCYFGGCGTIFMVDRGGHETVLHTFTGRADGQLPFDRLVLDKAGNLYGTTENGGNFSCNPNGCGVVFRLRLRDRKFTVLHTFRGKHDGSFPTGGLILDEKGNLYGAAGAGGDSKYGDGTIFRIKP